MFSVLSSVGSWASIVGLAVAGFAALRANSAARDAEEVRRQISLVASRQQALAILNQLKKRLELLQRLDDLTDMDVQDAASSSVAAVRNLEKVSSNSAGLRSAHQSLKKLAAGDVSELGKSETTYLLALYRNVSVAIDEGDAERLKEELS